MSATTAPFALALASLTLSGIGACALAYAVGSVYAHARLAAHWRRRDVAEVCALSIFALACIALGAAGYLSTR